MAGGGAVGLDGLSVDDLSGLRLAAQVMAHRAQLTGRPAVALYFDWLEALAMAEGAARGQSGPASPTEGVPAAPTAMIAAGEDVRLIGEYLAVLADNERLSPALRDLCRVLGAGPSAPRRDA